MLMQAIETSALAEQEAEPPVKSETDKVEVPLTTKAEALVEEEKTAVDVEVEASNDFKEVETVLEEEAPPAEEGTAVSVEALRKDDETKEVPSEQEPDAPKAKSEEQENQELMEETQPEVEQAQDELKSAEPVEVTDVIQEIVVEQLQSLGANESEATIEEFSEGDGEATNKEEDVDNEQNEADNVESSNEEEQSKVWASETVQMTVEDEQKEEENSFASALQPEEKSEAGQSDGHNSRSSSSKYEETNDAEMATPLTKQEFAFDEEKPSRKSSIVEDKIPSRKTSTMEEVPSRKVSEIPSRKVSEVPSRKVSEVPSRKVSEVPSRKVSTTEGKAFSRTASVVKDEELPSRKASEVTEKKTSSRKTSAVQEAKAPSRKTSEIEVPSRKTSAIEETKVTSRKPSAAQEKAPSRKISLEVEEKAPSRKISKMASLEETNESVTEKAKTEANDANVEPEVEAAVAEPESVADENKVEGGEAETMVEIQTEELKNEVLLEDAFGEVKKTPLAEVTNKDQKFATVNEREFSPSRKFTSPPGRHSPSSVRKRQERSPSPVRRNATYKSYDQDFRLKFSSNHQDTYRQKGPPPRMPSYLSFSSYTPVEKTTYSPISPWVQNNAQKYRNDYTAVSTYKPPSTYTSIFDDIVSSGPFSTSLYSTSRLLERSRSRSRELRNALRSKRSTSNYYRYTSNYATPPFRTRDYSTPPLSSVYHPSSRSGSFISFMEYTGQKQYELARSSSRLSAFDGLSRTSSRSNIDMFYDKERLSRVDSYVRDLNRNIEYGLPSTYMKYRSPSRPYLPQDYTPINGYRVCCLKFLSHYSYQQLKTSRIADLQRSLSRERLARERMNAKYKTLSHKLEQASRQMDLLRSNFYSSIRGGTGIYSVYSHNYPYF
ncbi:unnamed protein product [Onchocerca flexuosa]|uniref:Microtubule-associated protein futsch n=1 Tax=Onchocerca flexuosa TaxID=387005 RepID=A0A183I0G3_9BILA|nr:unnamed protein product [Onchocerca flexuosa]